MPLGNVKARRKKLGLTQKQLAHACNVSQSLIAKIEASSIDPSYSIAEQILDTLFKLEHKEATKAKDIMKKKITSVRSTDKVTKAIHLMRRLDISQLPVIDKFPVGSISEKTILEKVTETESLEEVSKKRVSSLMEEPFPIISENILMSSISELLKHNNALLVSKRGKIVGIITKSDLLKIVK